MESMALGGGEGGMQEKIGPAICQISFDLDSCIEKEAGLDGLIGPLPTPLGWDSMILFWWKQRPAWRTVVKKDRPAFFYFDLKWA